MQYDSYALLQVQLQVSQYNHAADIVNNHANTRFIAYRKSQKLTVLLMRGVMENVLQQLLLELKRIATELLLEWKTYFNRVIIRMKNVLQQSYY